MPRGQRPTDTRPERERPDPSDKPEVVDLGPGQSDHSFLLQAIMQVQRDLGGIGAKLDRVIADVGTQDAKTDALQHTVSFVKGAIWVIGGLITAVGALVAITKIQIGNPLNPPPPQQPPSLHSQPPTISN
jgi:hypothetical protein